MKPSGRFGLSGWQKAVLWGALAICVWRFLQVPVILDALLAFYAGGEIPGTDIVLSPDASLWFVCIVSGIGALALFVRLFVFKPRRSAIRRALREHGAKPVQQVQAIPVLPIAEHASPAAAVSPAGIAVAQLVAVQPAVTSAVKPSPWGRARAAQFSKGMAGARRMVGIGVAHVVARLRRGGSQSNAALRRTWVVLRPKLIAIAQTVRRATSSALHYVRIYGVRAAAFTALMLVTIWDWCKPYAQRFDTWLGTRLNQNQKTAPLIASARRAVAVLRELWQRAVVYGENRQRSKNETS